jgi:TPR repeat protein
MQMKLCVTIFLMFILCAGIQLYAQQTNDGQESFDIIKTKAEEGDVISQANLGNCYDIGLGVARDYAEAMKWYRKAADQGEAKAQVKVGDFYMQNTDDSQGVGVSDYWTAAIWFRKAAEQGNIDAQNKLGICYFNGGSGGLEKNSTEAVKWFRKAADQGYAIAQNNLAICYCKGEGATQDYVEAVKWFRKAAEQGNDQAQYELGNCYENGLGLTIDYAEAVKWCRKTTDQGNAEAKQNLPDFIGALKNSQPRTDDSTMPFLSSEKLDNFDAYFKRSNVEYLENKFDDAWADLNKVIELKPDFAPAYLGRADCEVCQKQRHRCTRGKC